MLEARNRQRERAIKAGRLKYSLINSLIFALVFLVMEQLFILLKFFPAASFDQEKLIKLGLVFAFFFAYNYFIRWPRIVKTNI